MNHVKDYLSQINQREDDRWERWSMYRNTLTEEILKVLLASTGDVLVIGSGALDDLDLHKIKPHVKSMTFLDLDRKITEEGLLRQGFALDSFSIIETDITCFDDLSFFQVWQAKMNEDPTYAEAIHFVDTMMKKVYALSFAHVIKQTFDTIIILPIYTQLIYHQWVDILEKTYPKSWSKDELNKVKTYLLDLMVPLVDHVNQGIKSCLKGSGSILAVSDMLEWNEHDWLLFKKTYPKLSEHELTEYYLSYVNQYGMGLGDYGLWSLKEKMMHQASRFLLWPFSKNRVMLVQMMQLISE